MALISDVELESGLAVEKAYLRIINFSGTDETLSFTVNIYVSEEAFENEKPAVSSKQYSMSYDSSRNLFRQAYEHLRTLPEYEGAVEA